ncbi:hypothetical protein [Streptacidiphilus sp. P02-A3a]|uniref:hypothetical protein n=1 Tax=Streptacidiphilus sp. P02-A3a TaxID=2704468 RepID=UPI0015FC3B94|nr:hypothetical protein [Streptacidiphilus sp. P02-A3a]QMU68419.1 hypothetical protein GXP74_09465 [Streptacidiphilus sp. P02-A3a]
MQLSTAGKTVRAPRAARAMVALGVAGVAAVSQFAFAPASGAATVERTGPGHHLRDGTDWTEHPLPIKVRFKEDLHGSVTRAGNTLMTCEENKPPVAKDAAPCREAQQGIGRGIFNNNYDMRYVNQYPGSFKLPPAEGGGYEKLYSSSSSELKVPANSTIKFARLYWGGTRGIGDTILPLSQVDGVLFKTPGGHDYHEVNTDPSYKDLGWMTGVGEGNAREHGYQASADVTDLVRNAGAGNYTVADMDSVVKPHSWGGWSLVVAYENCDMPLRHVEVSDGFQIELPESPPLKFTVDGLQTPQQGPIHGELGFVAYDGDRTYGHDSVSVQSTNGPLTVLHTWDKPADDFLNSTIENESRNNPVVRAPSYENQLGYDSNIVDVSHVLRNGDTSISFTFDTKSDGYQVGVVYSAVDLDQSS